MPEKQPTTQTTVSSLEGVSHIDLAPMSTVSHGHLMSVESRKTGGVFVKKAETEHMGATYVHKDEAREALEQEGLSNEEITQAFDSAQAGTSLQVEDLPGRFGHDRKVSVHSDGEKIGGGGKFLGKEGLVELPNGTYIDLKLVQEALLAPVVPESSPVADAPASTLRPVDALKLAEQGHRTPRVLRGLAAALALALALTMSSSTSADAPDHDEPVAAAPAYGEPNHSPIDTEVGATDQAPEESAVEEAPQETPGWIVEPGGGIISELEDELGMSYEEAEAAWIAIQPALKQAVAEGKIPADFFYEENGNLRINKAGPVPRDVQTLIEGLLGL